MSYIIPIGVGVVLVLIGLAIVWWLIDARREWQGSELFGPRGRHAAALLPLPPERPFPGDEPQEAVPAFLAAPLPAGELPDWVIEALGHVSAEDALDSIVGRATLTARVRAEEEAESSG